MKVHLEKTGSITQHKITFSYPALGFAFNPVVVWVFAQGGDVSATLVVESQTQGEAPIEITRETINGKVAFDLSAIVRSMFDRTKFHKTVAQNKTPWKHDLELCKTLNFKIKVGLISSENLAIPIVWGAMQIGELYSQSRNLKMFRGYPFTVPFLFLKLFNKGSEITPIVNNKLQISKDGASFYNYSADGSSVNINEGKYNFLVNDDFANKKVRFLIDNRSEEGFINTFDLSFDYTFTGLGQSSILVNLDILDTCDSKGYYLRWINAHGEYCYWLFKPQVESMVVENKGIEFDQYYTTVNYTDDYHVGTGKSIGKKVKKTLQLYADFVDSADFDFLMGLAQSPIVDLYMGKTDTADKWVNVNIQPATFPKGKEHLQDFSFMLELPQTQIQSL